MRRARLAIPALACALAAPSPARADDDEPRRVIRVDATGAERARLWYGWELLIGDGVAAGLLASGLALDSKGLEAGAIGAYLVSAPSIHGAHDHVGKAGASVGLRLVAPIALGLLFYGVTPDEHTRGDAGVEGAIFGMAAAIAIDCAVIAREDAPPPSREPIALTPSIAPVRGGATFGLSGSF